MINENAFPVFVYRFKEKPDVLITLGYVGCPACAGNLEFFAACGVKKVMFCGGDDVSNEEWDTRSWDKHHGIRYNLVMLCVELVKEI
ncbi:MAG: hypothetical protein IKX23_03505 [Treponema sp.]|nr:hypothetical protein [Treponema sp.]